MENPRYHIHTVDGAQLERLLLGIEHHVDHGAQLGGQHIVGRVEGDTLFQPRLERILRSEWRTPN